MTLFETRVAEAVAHLSAVDPIMRAVIAEIGPCTLAPAWQRSPFEGLIRAVAHQQLQGRAAEIILGRFLALFAPVAFPTPAEVREAPEEALRRAGFSRSKIVAIRDIAARAEKGFVPTRAEAERMDDDELIQRLTALRGIGRWTVEMLLIFALGRLDVFPLDDFGIKKGLTMAFHLEVPPSKQDMLATAERWRPYRSIASWYLWRITDGTPFQRMRAMGRPIGDEPTAIDPSADGPSTATNGSLLASG